MYQVWFDPNLNESIQRPASYNDYADEVFPIQEEMGFVLKYIEEKVLPLKWKA